MTLIHDVDILSQRKHFAYILSARYVTSWYQSVYMCTTAQSISRNTYYLLLLLLAILPSLILFRNLLAV